MRNVHYIPAIKKVTIDMWLEGKNNFEINNAIRNLLIKNKRRKLNHSLELS
jgi:hypothetical protein